MVNRYAERAAKLEHNEVQKYKEIPDQVTTCFDKTPQINK